MALVAHMGTQQEGENELLRRLEERNQTEQPQAAAVQCGWCEGAPAVQYCPGCCPSEEKAAFPEGLPLCGECDRVVHLRRTNRAHTRQPIQGATDEPATFDARDLPDDDQPQQTEEQK